MLFVQKKPRNSDWFDGYEKLLKNKTFIGLEDRLIEQSEVYYLLSLLNVRKCKTFFRLLSFPVLGQYAQRHYAQGHYAQGHYAQGNYAQTEITPKEIKLFKANSSDFFRLLFEEA